MTNDHPHGIAGVNDLQPDMADRLAKSLQVTGISVGDMAAYLEVNRNTVGAWINRRAQPNPANLRLWAYKVKLPVEWLRSGHWPENYAPEFEQASSL
jgi:hypothetical protein